MEELKLVLAAITTLGEAGREAFLWWLLADKVLPFVAIAGIALLVFVLVKRAMDVDGLDKFAQSLRAAMKIGSDGRLDTYDREQMLRWVKAKREKED